MENKCLFETRGESFCIETTSRLTKLSECRSKIDDQLQRWHHGKHFGSVQEHELILNRSGLPHDLASKQLDGKNRYPPRMCQYPLHPNRKKELISTRLLLHL